MARAMINIYFGILAPGPKVSHAMVVQFSRGILTKGGRHRRIESIHSRCGCNVASR